MPQDPSQPTTQTWNPVQEFRQNWPNANLSDQQILTNLQDPAKFRSAFPGYTGVTDDMIRTRMKAYLPPSPSTPPVKGPITPPSVSPTMDYLKGTVLPESLYYANQALTAPERYVVNPINAKISSWEQSASQAGLNSTPVGAAAKTFATGVAGDVGKMAVGLVGDPKNWPFLISGVGEVAEPLKVASSALFTALQQKGAIDAVKQGDYQNAAINEGFSLIGLAHLPGELKSSMLNQVKAQAGSEAFVDQAVQKTETPAPTLGKGTSAALLTTSEAPKSPIEQDIQSHTQEINRLQNVVNNPNALPEEIAYAQKALQASTDLRQDLMSNVPSQAVLTDLRRQEISQMAQAQARKPVPQELIAPPIATEGVAPLQPKQQELASNIEEQSQLSYRTGPDGVRYASLPNSPAEVSVPNRLQGAEADSYAQEKLALQRSFQEARLGAPDIVAPQPAQEAVPQPQRENPQAVAPAILNPALSQSLGRLSALKLQLESAPSDEARESIQNAQEAEMNRAKGLVRSQIGQMPVDQLAQLREHVLDIANRNAAQADGIRKLVEQHEASKDTVAAMRQVKSTGGPVREVVDPETGERMVAKPTAEVGRPGRVLMAELTGEKPRFQLVPNERPTKAPPEEWDAFQARLKDQSDALRSDIARAHSMIVDSGMSHEETGILDKIKEFEQIENMRGTYQPIDIGDKGVGRRPKVPVEVGPNGEVKITAPLQTIDKQTADRIFGRNLRKIPEIDQFQRLADQKDELARLHKAIGTAIDTQIGLKQAPQPLRNTEGGFIGEGPGVSTENPVKFGSIRDMLQNAKSSGFKFWLTKDRPSGYRGWLLEDGKVFVDADSRRSLLKKDDHDSTAWDMAVNREGAQPGDSQEALLRHGGIRKVSPTAYEVGELHSKATNTIEMDTIQNGKHGHDLLIDIRRPDGKVASLTIDAGWTDLSSALRKAHLREFGTTETGIAPTRMLAGFAAGMAVGGRIGGYPGMAIGGILGAVTPALLDTDVVKRGFSAVRPLIDNARINIREWARGPEDNPSISPAMQNIREKQGQSLKAAEQNLANRISMIPGDMWHAVDPFTFISDRPNPVMQYMMSQDPRGQYFRDAKGQFSLDESPYVAARNAISGIQGAVGVSRMMYGAIEREARSAGLHGETSDYLNLKGYARAYQVLHEHANELLQDTDAAKKQLAVSDDVREQLDLQDRIKGNVDTLKDIRDKIIYGTAVPGGYTPSTIQEDLGALQEKLGPQKWQQVQSYANRVFDVNRKALDLIADSQNGFKNGIISQELYQKFIDRGNEYIPMKRILETAAENNGRVFGKTSPLYLRQQQVIHMLEGSDAVNVDPWQASAAGHAEAIREFYRNKTLNTFLSAAQKDPDIGSYFTAVKPDYRAKVGEMVVGSYRNGVQQRYAVPDWLGHSLDTSSLAQAKTVMGFVMRAATQTFKAGATVFNPVWVATRQIPVLAGRAAISEMSRMAENHEMMDPVKLASTFAKAVKTAWTHDEQWMEFAKTGLARNSLMRLISPEDDLTNMKLGWKGPFAKPTQVLQSVRALSDLPSDIFQLNDWARNRQAGYSEEAATYKTQHYGPLPDYAQMGRADSPIGIATTFLRADWTHLRSTLSMATTKGYRGPLMLAGMAVAMATLPMLLHNVQQQDDNGKSLWARVPNSDKERYWVILTGGTDPNGRPNAIHIAKPDFVHTLFNPMEDAMSKALSTVYKGADPRSVTQLITNSASRFIPTNPQFDVNNMRTPSGAASEIATQTGGNLYNQVLPVVRMGPEELMNRQVQFGRAVPIVSNDKIQTGMQGYGQKNVSPTAMLVGQDTGFSPERFEHIGRSLLGPTFSLIEKGVNPLAEGHLNLPSPPTQGISGTNQTHVDQREIDLQNRFYSNVDAMSKPYNTYLMIKKSDPSAAATYLQQNRDALWEGRLASNLTERLNTINQYIHTVENNSQTDPATRQRALTNLHNAKMTILNSFNNILDETKNRRPQAESPMGIGISTK